MTQRDRHKDIVQYRRKQMSIAYYDLAKEQSESPFHSYWYAELYPHGNRKNVGNLRVGHFSLGIIEVHHLNSRDNSGVHDDVAWLVVLSRLEHQFCEQGCPYWGVTGIEYEYMVLWALRDSPKDRWRQPRQLKEQKIHPDRVIELQRKVKEALSG